MNEHFVFFYSYLEHLSVNKRTCWMKAFHNGRTRHVFRPEVQNGRLVDAIDLNALCYISPLSGYILLPERQYCNYLKIPGHLKYLRLCNITQFRTF